MSHIEGWHVFVDDGSPPGSSPPGIVVVYRIAEGDPIADGEVIGGRFQIEGGKVVLPLQVTFENLDTMIAGLHETSDVSLIELVTKPIYANVTKGWGWTLPAFVKSMKQHWSKEVQAA